MKKSLIDQMVDKFLSWPLPDSVASDMCVTKSGRSHRIGTNLLTADESREMIEYLLDIPKRRVGQHVINGCVLLDGGPIPCVFDDSNYTVEDCSAAVRLKECGKGRDDCEYWKPTSCKSR